jgi:formate dehydrogenase major subunit
MGRAGCRLPIFAHHRPYFVVDKQSSNFLEISPADARDLGLVSGTLLEVASRRGKIHALAVVTDRLSPGVVWMPMHFAASRANVLTGDGRDSEVGTPEYKVTAVRLTLHGH